MPPPSPEPTPTFKNEPFADVPAKHWAAAAIRSACAGGIFEGAPDDLFHGQRPLSRCEFAVIVARLIDRGSFH